MIALDIIKRAKSLIDTPEHWTINRYAADEDHRHMELHDSRACRHCAVGALLLAEKLVLKRDRIRVAEVSNLLNGFAVAAGFHLNSPGYSMHDFAGAITWFNDNGTHESVMGMFDKVIKELEKDPQDASYLTLFDYPQS